MKKIICLAVLFCSVVLLAGESDKPTESTPQFARNRANSLQHISSGATGSGGLAPSTWGLTSRYSGTLYGTGYYAFGVNNTYAGTNSIGAYTYSYPSFSNDIRAIYAFDISILAGVPGPIWSSFMFDTRERPSAGTKGFSIWAEITLVSDEGTHTIEGVQVFVDNNAANLDIYDAAEFENADPFANPDLAYTGVNPLIGTVAVVTDTVIPLSFDATDAVVADLPATIPTLGEYGMIAFLSLFAVAGLIFIRRKRTA